MSKLLDFKKELEKRGLCETYATKWRNAETKMDLVRIASDGNGAEVMCTSIAYGWNPMDVEYITSNFADCINGKYVFRQKGYTSEMFVGIKNGTIAARSTLLLLIGCNCSIFIPETLVCQIYIAKSFIEITGNGRCEVFMYGSPFCGYNDVSVSCKDNENAKAAKITDKNKWTVY